MLKFLDRDRLTLLTIALGARAKGCGVIVVGTLPGIIIRHSTEGLGIQRAAGIGKHGHGLADPNALPIEIVLPTADLLSIIFLRQHQVSLYPGNAAARQQQQLRDAAGGNAAVLVEPVAAPFADGFDTGLP